MAIYLHEIITIDRSGKEGYLEALRTGWVPYAEQSRGMRLVWIGSTIGSTAHWPETMAMWELRDWEHYAEVCDRMYTESTGDATMKDWWQAAFKFRQRSHSQTLVGADFSPGLDELLERGVSGTAYSFASYRFAPGRGREFLAALAKRVSLDAVRGRQLVGAYEVAFTNSAAYAVWAHRGLKEICEYEAGLRQDGPIAEWQRSVAGLLEHASEFWGFATPASPLWPKDYKTETRIW